MSPESKRPAAMARGRAEFNAAPMPHKDTAQLFGQRLALGLHLGDQP